MKIDDQHIWKQDMQYHVNEKKWQRSYKIVSSKVSKLEFPSNAEVYSFPLV